MVERFNGRINELLQQTRFDSRADLEATLMNYLKLYNHHIPQRAIDSKTPILALKEWQKKRPELFVKRVYEQAGLDTYPHLVWRLPVECTLDQVICWRFEFLVGAHFSKARAATRLNACDTTQLGHAITAAR